MINDKKFSLDGVSLELSKKVNKNGVSYYACDMVFPSGYRRQVGFALDFYVIRKKYKEAKTNGTSND